MCTVLSHDLVNDPDMVAMIAASAALTISGAPFMGPIAAARVGFVDGEYILNPEIDDLVVAGTKDAVMMVESEAYELTEEEMLGAVTFAHESIQPVIDLIIDLAEDAAKEPFDFQPPDYADLFEVVKKAGEKDMSAAYAILDKQERTAAVSAAKAAIIEGLSEEQNFMLHYNFPPYSVGEVGRVSGPGRREIGHGKLAWRAVEICCCWCGHGPRDGRRWRIRDFV